MTFRTVTPMSDSGVPDWTTDRSSPMRPSPWPPRLALAPALGLARPVQEGRVKWVLHQRGRVARRPGL